MDIEPLHYVFEGSWIYGRTRGAFYPIDADIAEDEWSSLVESSCCALMITKLLGAHFPQRVIADSLPDKSLQPGSSMPTLTWPYVHLLINHFPVVLTVVALVAALGALITNRRGLWLNAMGLLSAAGLVVYPVHFTGDEADHALRDPWYIKSGVIDAHDKAAGIAMWIILIAGAIAAYGWWRALKRRDEIIPGWIRAAVLVGVFAGFGSVAYTAYLGGKIIHDAPVLGLPEAPAGLPPGIATPPRGSAREP